MEEFQQKLGRWWTLYPREAKQALTKAALLVSNEVQGRHLTGPKMPRGVGGTTDATLATQSGRLRRSIWHSVEQLGPSTVSARVGTNVRYARIHEYGGTIQNAWGRNIRVTMPERPFLRPSLEKMRPRALEIIQQAMVDSLAGGHRGV